MPRVWHDTGSGGAADDQLVAVNLPNHRRRVLRGESGRRPAQLRSLLSVDGLPPEIERQTRRNLVFYAPS